MFNGEVWTSAHVVSDSFCPLQKTWKTEPDSFRRELLNSGVNIGGRTARQVNALPTVDETHEHTDILAEQLKLFVRPMLSRVEATMSCLSIRCF